MIPGSQVAAPHGGGGGGAATPAAAEVERRVGESQGPGYLTATSSTRSFFKAAFLLCLVLECLDPTLKQPASSGTGFQNPSSPPQAAESTIYSDATRGNPPFPRLSCPTLQRPRRVLPLKIAAFGGSVTWGSAMEHSPESTYVNLVASFLRSACSRGEAALCNISSGGVEVNNAAIRAAGSAIPYYCLDTLIADASSFDIVLLEFAINGYDEIEGLVSRLQNANPEVVLIGVTVWSMQGSLLTDFFFSQRLRAIGVPVIDIHAGVRRRFAELETEGSLFASDKHHFNENGHRITAELITQFIVNTVTLCGKSSTDKKTEQTGFSFTGTPQETRFFLLHPVCNSTVGSFRNLVPPTAAGFQLVEFADGKVAWTSSTPGSRIAFPCNSFNTQTVIIGHYISNTHYSGGRFDVFADGHPCFTVDTFRSPDFLWTIIGFSTGLCLKSESAGGPVEISLVVQGSSSSPRNSTEVSVTHLGCM
jgi:hypothetical protein